MRRSFCVGVVLLLAFVIQADPLSGQTDPNRGRSRLVGNYPNPFNPDTRIEFMLDATDLSEGGPARVTITIYNYFRQIVAHPLALNHPAGNGAVVNNLEYHTPGQHEVFWDGTDRNGNKVASGRYFAQLTVNGRRPSTIMLVVAK